MRKPVFGVSDQVRHKPGCTAIEDGLRLEISNLENRRNYSIYVAKTKALIRFAVTAKLICVFVFAYGKSRFSHDKARMKRFVNTPLQHTANSNSCKNDNFQMKKIWFFFLLLLKT